MFSPQVQVKQFLCVVRGRWGWFNVYATGDAKAVLFRAVHNGVETGLEFPVLRSRLRRGVIPPIR